MAEMNWGELKSGKSGESASYMKILPGVNIVRVVALPYETEIHWEESNDGGKKRIVCPGVGCPVCKAGHVPQKKFQVLIIDRADSKLKILEGGSSIFGQIKTYAMDADYGDPSKYDLKIKKEGSGRETKYTIMASPNKTSLTTEEQGLLDNSKSLSDLNKPKTVEEIIQMDLSILGGISSSNVAGGWGEENTTTISGDTGTDDWDNL